MACSPKGANDRRINQYYKITLLDSITKQIEKASNIQMNIQYNPMGTFEEVVDLENPHQSLQGLMENAEHNFTLVVETLLENNVSLGSIKRVIQDKGKELAVDSNNLEEVYNYLNGTILDGMPCDETKQVIESTENKLVYKRLEDMHSKYWKNADTYYQLLTCFVNAMLLKTNIKYSDQNHTLFTLSK